MIRDDSLAAFPYVNGRLFADENIEVPRFTENIHKVIDPLFLDDLKEELEE